VKVENRDKTSANVTVRAQIIGPKGEVAGKAEQALDPARPITMAVPGPYDHNLPEWQANDPCFLHLDVGGYNYQWQQYEVDHNWR
jgi:hypothetical protein